MSTDTRDPETRFYTVQKPNLKGAAVLYGFAAALAIWCTWFITHLPWLGIPERVSMPSILAVWLIAALFAGIGRPSAAAFKVGFSSGLIAAMLGLLVLGSKVSTPAPGFEALQPPLMLTALGFLSLGAAVGTVGALLGSLLPQKANPTYAADDRARFGILTAIALAPLLVIGGLVTSTNSGMAVPDWPNTFGSNMFLYPLGPRAAPDVYFEHSHRLFGAFVGLAMLTLMVWVLLTESRRWLKNLAVLAFLLVCVQGVLGGIRVLDGSQDIVEDRAAWRMVHGILAQLVFGLIVGIAVSLTPTFRRLSASAIPAFETVVNGRALRFFTTGFLHALLPQLLLGAWFRHTRDLHTMWSHAAFALVVVVFATAAGFAAGNIKASHAGAGPILQRTGKWIVAVVALQFILGWATFGFGGLQLEPDSPAQALIRTAHQANGALTLALAVIAFVWTRRILRTSRELAGVNPAATSA